VNSVEYAEEIGFDRIEIYTGPFARFLEEEDHANLTLCKSNIVECINLAKKSKLGINAGHDLNLDNLPHLKECGNVDEVSIGHAIITDALKFGFDNTIMKYIKAVRNQQ
jgi:pyridoxine 5-phosphate synthase